MAATVAVSDLTGGVTRRADVPPGAKRERVYISQYALGAGEGVDDAGLPGPGFTPGSPGEAVSQAFTMIGKYQPYGFYEPTTPSPHGLQLALHGLAENHSARLYFPGTGGNFVKRFGDDRNRIIATPMGRGWKGWYSSYSERDVFDVLADVEANYAVDTDHVEMSGYSMGGFGAMRLAALHPDLFAGVVNWVGFTGDVFNGTPFGGTFHANGTGGGADINVVDLVGSLRHVPMAALYSGADELVHVQTGLDLRQTLSDLHVPSIFYFHPAADHVTYMLTDDWTKESMASADDTLVHDPAHVTFETARNLYEPDLGLVPDHAYWVSAIVPAADGAATVDAVSLGCGVDEPQTADAPGVGTDPVPWESNEVRVTGVTHRPAANRLELSLTNVASLHIDLDRACLTASGLDMQVTTEQPTTITFSNGETRTFEPEALPRTGGSTPQAVVLLLVAAVAVRLVVGRSGGRRRLRRA
jgi:pimeloyl-ACP methyl ester carboxylesterase